MKQQEYYFEIEDNASSEVIVWNKYPDEKPEASGAYLVQYGGLLIPYKVSHWQGFRDKYFLDYDGNNRSKFIIAWAELPKGWKEEQE